MDASACGTLPALSACCTLKNLRERFAALRGSGHPLRLLVDVRPEGDQRHHLEGAIASNVERSTEHHLRFVGLCVVASEDADHRSIVRAWLVGEPASQDAVAAACKLAGAWLHPRLVSARLVSGSMPAGAVAWSSALAAISGGAFRLVAKPHSLGDVDVVVPEAGVPASGPLSELLSRLEGAEFTPDRLFVIEDVVETSIVLLDRLDEGLPKRRGRDASGRVDRKPPRGPRKRGRPPLPDNTGRGAAADFWFEKALDTDDDDLRESLARGNQKPREVYDSMKEHGLEVKYSSVKKDPPAFWPKVHGEPVHVWRFADYAADVSRDSFDRYIGLRRSRTRGTAAAEPRATTVNTEIIQAGSGGRRSCSPAERQAAALQKAEESLFAVAQKMSDTRRWDAARRAMIAAGIDAGLADELLAGHDEAALTRVGEHFATLQKSATAVRKPR